VVILVGLLPDFVVPVSKTYFITIVFWLVEQLAIILKLVGFFAVLIGNQQEEESDVPLIH